jgi:hypothetical protein
VATKSFADVNNVTTDSMTGAKPVLDADLRNYITPVFIKPDREDEEPQAKQDNQHIIPVTTLEPGHEYPAETSIPQIVPVIKQERVVEEGKQSKSRLIIGRITVQVLPAEKKQVIHKIEKRTIVESKPVTSQVSNKFIFGLGQL